MSTRAKTTSTKRKTASKDVPANITTRIMNQQRLHASVSGQVVSVKNRRTAVVEIN